MDELDVLSEMERLLLMAAAVHKLGPMTDLGRANTAKVVGQSLLWAGMLEGETRQAWDEFEYDPVIIQVYGVLIRLIQQKDAGTSLQRPEELLFEGRGDFGTPEEPHAFPHFTSCRLTAHGEQLAQLLLERYPQYRSSRT